MSATPAQFALPFSHYARLGYLPVALSGKVPFYSGWQDKRYSETELAELDAAHAFNVGLLCENIVGLDIDVVDERHAKKLEVLIRKVLSLPRNTWRRVGRAPKALLMMRVDSPLPGFDVRHAKKTVLFQLLGAGKQFVIHGTHPDTGKPYTLNRPLPAVAKLPLLTPEKLTLLHTTVMQGLAAMGYDVGSKHAVGGPKGDAFSGPPWSATGRQQALSELATLDPDMDRMSWIECGMAIHDGTHGDEEGFAMWDAWSSQSAKYKQREMRKQWASFKPGRGTTRASLFKNNWLKRAVVARPAPERAITAQESHELDLSTMLARDVGAVPWLVAGILTHGAHLLVGRPKGGKSWATMDLVYAVANGGKFVGKSATRGRVLWFASEDTGDGLTRRVKVRGESVDPNNVTILTMEGLRAERKLWDACEFHEMLDARLAEQPVDLVIIDTQKTCEAVWREEQIDETRRVSVVDSAYQSVRLYDEIGQRRRACIVLVHHTGKQKNNRGTDYHERINMPATVVAGVTGSMVLADLPDRDLHEKDDFQRVLAIRGRHMSQGDEQVMVEIKMGRVELLGQYIEVVQTRTQAEVFAQIEAMLKDQEVVKIADVAAAMGKHKNSVQRALARAAKVEGGLMWKGRRLVLVSGHGIRWQG